MSRAFYGRKIYPEKVERKKRQDQIYTYLFYFLALYADTYCNRRMYTARESIYNYKTVWVNESDIQFLHAHDYDFFMHQSKRIIMPKNSANIDEIYNRTYCSYTTRYYTVGESLELTAGGNGL